MEEPLQMMKISDLMKWEPKKKTIFGIRPSMLFFQNSQAAEHHLNSLNNHNTSPNYSFPCGSNGMPATLEAQVRSLGWEDPLEKGMATHSSIRT